MTHIPIAIVGAGMAGLAAARTLPPSSYQILRKVEGQGGGLLRSGSNNNALILALSFSPSGTRDFKRLSNLRTSWGDPIVGTSNGNISIVDAGRFTRYSDTLCGCAP